MNDKIITTTPLEEQDVYLGHLFRNTKKMPENFTSPEILTSLVREQVEFSARFDLHQRNNQLV